MQTRKISLLVIATTLSASGAVQAAVDFTLQNSTKKSLSFSLMVPRTKIMSKLRQGHVSARAQAHFSSNTLLPRCRQSWQCNKLKVVVQNWGKQVVFVECPKIKHATGYTRKLHYKIIGNDSSSLFCRQISRTAARRYEAKRHTQHSGFPPWAPTSSSLGDT